MTSEITKFEQFFASVTERLDQAQTTDEVIEIHKQASVLAAAARAAKDREYEEKAATVKLQSERRLGQLMAAQRDAGMMKVGRPWPKSNGVSNTPLPEVGIDKNLAKAARKAYPEGWPKKARHMTPEEKIASGRSPGTDRYVREDGSNVSRIKLKSDELRAALARIAELEEENARLKNDLEALQIGNLMQMSRASMLQRRELKKKIEITREKRRAVETVPDEKTKEEFERQIKNLKGQLKSARNTVSAFMQNGKTVLDKEARKAILVCLHPDSVVDLNEKAKREKAFKLFSNAVPEPEF